MTKQVQFQRAKTLCAFAHGYMFFTLMGIILLLVTPLLSLPLPGSSAIFYLFVSLMLFPETETLFTVVLALLILLAMFAYPISLLVSYILVLLKKWYRLFGILMGTNVLIIACVTLAIVIVNRSAPPFIPAIDIIVNTFYTVYYFRLLRTFTREQVTLPPCAPAPTENSESP